MRLYYYLMRSTGAVARELGLTRRRVTQLCANGKLRAIHVGDRWLVLDEDLDRFKAERGLDKLPHEV